MDDFESGVINWRDFLVGAANYFNKIEGPSTPVHKPQERPVDADVVRRGFRVVLEVRARAASTHASKHASTQSHVVRPSRRSTRTTAARSTPWR